MEEEFYATLKLVSGEEIVSKVCYLPDEDKILLDKPLQVEHAKQKKGHVEVTGFTFKDGYQQHLRICLLFVEIMSSRC